MANKEHIALEDISWFVEKLLQHAVAYEYAREIAESEEFIKKVREDVETSSAWHPLRYYGFDDVRLALGRTILNALNGGKQ